MKYGEFPIGQPQLVVVNELPRGELEPFPWTRPEQNPFRGLLLCRVLAPRMMNPAALPPLLPYFSEGERSCSFHSVRGVPTSSQWNLAHTWTVSEAGWLVLHIWN